MIITCVNCNKKFNVDSQLIPNEGRTIQCGSCNHTWFFNKNNDITIDKKPPLVNKSKIISPKKQEAKKVFAKTVKEKIAPLNKKDNIIKNNKKTELIKYQSKTSFSFFNFLSYLLVLIISFIALIIVIDTFKSPLFVIFPKLEFLLFSLFETLKDIELFIKDLI